MKKPKPTPAQAAALAIVRKNGGYITLTQEHSPREWATFNALADAGFLTWYLGAEMGSRVFTLRPNFKEK